MANLSPDYYISARETEIHPNPWRWDIRRYSKPMAVNLFEVGFQSKTAAEFAGKRGLLNFLNLLAAEKRQDRE